MKIGPRIILFTTVVGAVISVVVAFVLIYEVRSVTTNLIADESVQIASATMDSVDAMINSKIEQARVYAVDLSSEYILLESNEAFDNISNRDEYIETLDSQWQSGQGEDLINQVINNDLSEEIRVEIQNTDFYHERYGYDIFPEIFVTNKYGVNVAATNATSDYYQADEKRWQITKEKGVFVSDLERDDSAEVYSIGISVRIEDEEDNFLGVLTVIYDIREVIRIIENVKKTALMDDVARVNESINITLVTDDHLVVHSTNSHDTLERYPDYLSNKITKEEGGGHFFESASGSKEEKLYAYSYSTNNYSDLDWYLVNSYDKDAILSPSSYLIWVISLTLFLAIAISIIGIILLARSITNPIKKLSREVKAVEKGDFDRKVGTSRHDEIGELSRAFDKMVESLKKSWSEVDKKVKEQTEDIIAGNEKLKRSKAIDDAILKAIGNGITVVDKDGKILFINTAAREMLGLKEEDFKGREIAELVKRETEQGENVSYNDYVLAKVLNGEKFEVDMRERYYFIRSDGTRFPATISVTPVVLGDSIVGAVEVFRDATEDVEIDNAKTEFVSLASHQLRTPLSTINWYTEMLLGGDAGEINEEQKQFLEEIYTGNQRMVQLVNALLNVSRIEAGTLSVTNKSVDLVAVVEDVLKEMEQDIKNKKLDIDFVDNEKDITFSADTNVVHIVIQNIISNAIKYTPEKGKITINLDEKNDKIIFSVSDTGYGIPENEKENIFTKLYRAENIKQKVTDGTGLGLYMVKKIMDKLGGDIRFESEEGEGSTFYVTWPASGMREQRGTKDLASGAYKIKE